MDTTAALAKTSILRVPAQSFSGSETLCLSLFQFIRLLSVMAVFSLILVVDLMRFLLMYTGFFFTRTPK